MNTYTHILAVDVLYLPDMVEWRIAGKGRPKQNALLPPSIFHSNVNASLWASIYVRHGLIWHMYTLPDYSTCFTDTKTQGNKNLHYGNDNYYYLT